MGQSITTLLEFLAIAFDADMDVWSASGTDEAVVRAVAREYSRPAQQAPLNELENQVRLVVTAL